MFKVVQKRFLNDAKSICLFEIEAPLVAKHAQAGSYVAAMNGVDAIVFTAGVGENSKSARKAISEYFGYLGVTIDDEANSKRGEDIMISTPDSKVKVFVIPTNEELVIARDTRDIVG